MQKRPRSDQDIKGRLVATLCLNAAIALTEIIAGMFAGSIALVADAVHNFGDTCAVTLALFARVLSSRPPSLRHTYGLIRFEVLAAFLNAAVLVVAAILMVERALFRLLHPEPIHAGLIILVATVAFAANSASALLLHRHHPHDLNLRAVFLHLVQDVLSSLLVVVSATLTYAGLGTRLDAVAAMIIAGAVLFGVVPILKQAMTILLEGVPDGIHLQSVVDSVEHHFDGIAMHHVHVWQIGLRQHALTAHLLMPNMDVAAAEALCDKVRVHLQQTWQIQHSTLQPEVKGCGSETLLGTWYSTGDGD